MRWIARRSGEPDRPRGFEGHFAWAWTIIKKSQKRAENAWDTRFHRTHVPTSRRSLHTSSTSVFSKRHRSSLGERVGPHAADET